MVSETTPMVLAEGHITRWLWISADALDALEALRAPTSKNGRAATIHLSRTCWNGGGGWISRCSRAIMAAYLHTTTRKVDDLVKALGADVGISRSKVSRSDAFLSTPGADR